MAHDPKSAERLKMHLRAAIEVAFIVFLFYSNLLMGEFNRSNGAGKHLKAAVWDILTPRNFVIAIVAAVVAHGASETLRRRL
jgi:hypothetical protein